MGVRRCAVCSADISHRAGQARTCSLKCQRKSYRRRNLSKLRQADRDRRNNCSPEQKRARSEANKRYRESAVGKLRRKVWLEKNRSKINDYNRKYRSNNVEKVRAYERKYRKANRERRNAQQRERIKSCRVLQKRIAAYQERYRAKPENKERRHKSYVQNREKYRADRRRRAAAAALSAILLPTKSHQTMTGD